MSAEAVDVEQFQRRILQDAMTEATAAYWRRRAEMFRWAAPREGDYPGQTTVEQRREQWRRAMASATACDQRALLVEQHGLGVTDW